MLSEILKEKNILTDVKCSNWEELVNIGTQLLIDDKSIEPSFVKSIKDTIAEYGAYMVLLEDIAFFHGAPDSGVNELCMSLCLLDEPVYLNEKRIKAAFVFAAVDKESHLAVLQEFAELLQNDRFLELLKNHGDKDEIYRYLKGEENI